ncbi:Protein of unknown function [Paenibacillus catalpae]|uniref:DUF2568 domain-containing protein n=2 Tax=Paenibacillus catalpae TaxID=1045775 RepID=A0A1I1VAH7_9BACL|nr:Protein of unknown function [Paenibacillus catalpae]
MKSIAVGILLTAFFLLELAACAAFGFWGYQLDVGGIFKIILMIALPLAVIILWGMFLSPKASIPIFADPIRTTLKLIVFLAASAALYTTGRHGLGIVFLTASIIVIGSVFILDLHRVNVGK